MGRFYQIFDDDGLIKIKKNDYVPRESQIDAADKIYDALKNNKHFILEGPCGFGKTFAYLIPVFERHINSKLRTIIVTDGISLQEQLVNKDLPFVNDIFRTLYSKEITFALLKGKGNFLCKRKYWLVRDSGTAEKSEQMDIIKKWSRGTVYGDFSELSIKPDPLLHNKISCTQEGECDGRTCAEFETCYYQSHKTKAQKSEIIVTNYHLLFSDWKIGNILLPKYDIAVFDEAHEFASRFRDFRVEKFSSYSTRYLKSDISEMIAEFKEINKMLSDDVPETLQKLFDLSISLNKDMEEYCLSMYTLHFHDDKHAENKLIDAYTILIDNRRDLICSGLRTMQYYLEEILDSLGQYAGQQLAMDEEWEDTETRKYRDALKRLMSRTFRFVNTLSKCQDEGDNPDIVYWIDKSANYNNKLKNEQRISFCYKPINVANDIEESFLRREDVSCIFTSATLSTNGNFDFIKKQTGIDLCPKERFIEFIGESPFDLRKQQFWYVPEDGMSAKDARFVEELPMRIEKIVGACQGGALCLFTSNANMNKAYDELETLFKTKHGIKLLLQGQKPSNKLIKEFYDDVDSVLFATKSFFSGVDVPGYSLRCLIIDKLPFPHLNDPVLTKIKNVLGLDIMFKHYSIPMMLITLKQAIGRGVRSIYDKCVVSILDNRFRTERSYKDVFSPTFPWNRGSGDIDDVITFLFPEKGDYL